MFLKSLTIKNDSETIREIFFKKGVNLIVDETKEKDRKESGNNIGKTTVLRLIDFCLGSDGKNIYQDPEFKNKTNDVIEDFLKENNIIVTLVLKENLDIENSKEIIIKRNFLEHSKKIIEINGNVIKSKDFNKKLKEIIFNSTTDKPSIRQIISKNIRDEKSKLDNTVKTLYPVPSREDYEAVYLFWLGFDRVFFSRKQLLRKEEKEEKKFQKELKKRNELSQIIQSLKVVNRTIKELEEQRDNFNIDKKHKNDFEELNIVKSDINELSTKLGQLELRKNLIQQSAEELKKEFSDVDTDKIKKLYDSARAFIPEIQKTYEETLEFHNSMINERKRYITKEFPSLEKEISKGHENLETLLSKEKKLSDSLYKYEVMESFSKISIEINKAYEGKGELENQKKLWEDSLSKFRIYNK